MTISRLAERLRNAQHVVAFTGAGASAESGIPNIQGRSYRTLGAV